MTTFYLLRHGQKEDIFGDPPLTHVGKKQAEITGKHLINKNIQTVISSPSKRTIQTAGIISKHLNLAFQNDNRLRERMNWGDKEGETFVQFMSEWIKTDLNRDYQPIHGDSSIQAGIRLEASLNTTKQGNVLFITHGGVIGDLLRNLFTEERLPIIKDKSSNVHYVEILECSITAISKRMNSFTLMQVGDVSHLPVPLI